VHHIHEQARGGEHSRYNCLILCDDHHTKVHAGDLVLSGDAEGKVEFRDASGQLIGSSLPPAAGDVPSDAACGAVGGVTGGAVDGATRAGASLDARDERLDWDGMDSTCARVLAVMGSRGGWNVDRLVEATGLSVQVVLQAKCMLELQGKGGAFAG
jgi:hypothetical protein